MSKITVQSITKASEYEELEAIQLSVWGMTEREVIPGRFMHALQHNGASLLGAYDNDKLIGFVLGVISTVEGMNERIDQIAAARLQLYSAIMAVQPEYQQHGVGYQLKMAQRDFALQVGIRLITWTYDPLQSRNAWFNFGKLGVICNHYFRNFHGEMSGLNAGMPSDRFEVQWWITSNRVKSRTAGRRRPLSLDALVGGGAALVNETTINENGLPVPPNNFDNSANRMVLVEIPSDFTALKSSDVPLAQRWREHSRRLFEHYFERNYVVTDFARHKEASGRARSFYLLTHRSV